MEAIHNDSFIFAEDYNSFLEQGFKFCVKGDWEYLDSIDPWSGMPNAQGKIHFFTDRAEAEAYAKTQHLEFNQFVHPDVEEMSHKETCAECEARIAAAEKARADKKKQREVEKANALGMSLEEYQAFKKEESKKKRYAREIASMKKEIAELEKQIAIKQAYLDNN